jgi:hypothetical protein
MLEDRDIYPQFFRELDFQSRAQAGTEAHDMPAVFLQTAGIIYPDTFAEQV